LDEGPVTYGMTDTMGKHCSWKKKTPANQMVAGVSLF
jgi:hypothetical protein